MFEEYVQSLYQKVAKVYRILLKTATEKIAETYPYVAQCGADMTSLKLDLNLLYAKFREKYKDD